MDETSDWIRRLMSQPDDVRLHNARLHRRSVPWEFGGQPVHRQLIVIVERGQLRVSSGNTHWNLLAGQGCWLPRGAGRILSFAGDGEERHWNLTFSVPNSLSSGPLGKPFARSGLEALPSLLWSLRNTSISQCASRTTATLAAILTIFASSADIHAGQGRLSNDQVRKIDRWLELHLCHDPKPSDIAHILDLSEDYLARVFKRTYGISMRTWIRDMKIHAAASDLVDENLCLQEVCDRYGYSSKAFFCRQFKDVLGITPGKWVANATKADVNILPATR